jgi:hypothetical protein
VACASAPRDQRSTASSALTAPGSAAFATDSGLMLKVR